MEDTGRSTHRSATRRPLEGCREWVPGIGCKKGRQLGSPPALSSLLSHSSPVPLVPSSLSLSLCICLSLCLSPCVCLSLSLHLSVSLSVHLSGSVSLSISLSLSLSISLSLSLSISLGLSLSPSLCLYLSLYIFVCVCLCLSLSLYLSLSPPPPLSLHTYIALAVLLRSCIIFSRKLLVHSPTGISSGWLLTLLWGDLLSLVGGVRKVRSRERGGRGPGPGVTWLLIRVQGRQT